jgi:hypothetical protein
MTLLGNLFLGRWRWTFPREEQKMVARSQGKSPVSTAGILSRSGDRRSGGGGDALSRITVATVTITYKLVPGFFFATDRTNPAKLFFI